MRPCFALAVLAACGPSATTPPPPIEKPLVKPVATKVEFKPFVCQIQLRVMNLFVNVQRDGDRIQFQLSGNDVRNRGEDYLGILRPMFPSAEQTMPALFKSKAKGMQLHFAASACTFKELGLYRCEGPAEIRYLDQSEKPTADPAVTRPVKIDGVRVRKSDMDGDRDEFALRMLLTDETPAVWLTTDTFHECR